MLLLTVKKKEKKEREFARFYCPRLNGIKLNSNIYLITNNDCELVN